MKDPPARTKWLMVCAAAAPLLIAAFQQRASDLGVGPLEAAWAILLISVLQAGLAVWLGGAPSAKQETENAYLRRDNDWLRTEHRRLAREEARPSS